MADCMILQLIRQIASNCPHSLRHRTIDPRSYSIDFQPISFAAFFAGAFSFAAFFGFSSPFGSASVCRLRFVDPFAVGTFAFAINASIDFRVRRLFSIVAVAALFFERLADLLRRRSVILGHLCRSLRRPLLRNFDLFGLGDLVEQHRTANVAFGLRLHLVDTPSGRNRSRPCSDRRPAAAGPVRNCSADFEPGSRSASSGPRTHCLRSASRSRCFEHEHRHRTSHTFRGRPAVSFADPRAIRSPRPDSSPIRRSARALPTSADRS